MRPFTEARHDQIRQEVRSWAQATWPRRNRMDEDPRLMATTLARQGLFRLAVPQPPDGVLDPLTLVVVREELAASSGLADALFAVQGLAAHPIGLAGSAELRARWLPPLADGTALGAFAVTEPEAGSDLGAIATTARAVGDGFVLDGHKTFISNAGLAQVYVTLARSADETTRPYLLFAVPADSPGLETSPIELMASHPVGSVKLRKVEVPRAALLGRPGDGLALCLGTLELFRPTVGAAACGIARRAFDEARRRVRVRQQFGQPLQDHQSVAFALAEMATKIETARLLVYRAAWLKVEAARTDETLPTGQAAAMAKWHATEMAQQVVDQALQLHGAAGLVRGGTMETLYREVRALRIYEGTSEVQKMIIARSLREP